VPDELTHSIDRREARQPTAFQPPDEMPVVGDDQAKLGTADPGLAPVGRDLVQQDVDFGMALDFHDF